MPETAIALGTFDGLHRGHRQVLRAALQSGKPALAVTFDRPPRQTLLRKTSGQLLTAAEKRERLLKMGFRDVISLDFAAVRDLPPAEFLALLRARFSPALLCCGYNYRFGAGGAGDTALLAADCRAHGVALSVSDPVCYHGEAISSTAIRARIAAGEMPAAAEMLGEPFGFTAPVVHGDERGRTIGFPTVNQPYPDELIRPRFGVYRAIFTVDGKSYDAVVNFGVRPTYPLDCPLAETYILDFHETLYDRTARVAFAEFYRPERPFESLAALREQIARNVEQVRAFRAKETGGC